LQKTQKVLEKHFKKLGRLYKYSVQFFKGQEILYNKYEYIKKLIYIT